MASAVIGRVLALVAALSAAAGCRTVVRHPDGGASAGAGGDGAGAGGAGVGGGGIGGAGIGGGGVGGGVGSGGVGGGGIGGGGVGGEGIGGSGVGGGGGAVVPVPRRRLAGAGLRMCALGSDGIAWCWGSQAAPTSPSSDSASPVAVKGGGAAAIDIGANSGEVCLLKSEGSIYCLGRDHDAILSGIGGRAVALTVGGAPNDMFGCAIRADSTVFCWGDGDSNPLGPVALGWTAARAPGLDDAVDIAAGGRVACALRRDGTLWCWGAGAGELISMSPTGERTERPRLVPELGTDVAAVFAGGGGVCAAKADGSVRCWGTLFGAPAIIPSVPDFQPEARFTGARRIAIGNTHACAIGPDRTLTCFGANDHGQLGDGTFVAHAAPAPVVGLGGPVAEVVAGDQTTCAMLESGHIRCFGNNDLGTVGDGSALSLGAAAVDLGGSPVVSHDAARSGQPGSAVLPDGSVRVWGPLSPMLIEGAPVRAARPIDLTTPATAPPARKASVSYRRACILTRDGAVSCLTAAVTPGAMAPLAVASMFGTGVEDLNGSCAVRSDGYGHCSLPTGLAQSSVPAASSGMFKKLDAAWFSGGCALLRDGRIECFDGPPLRSEPVEQLGGPMIDLSAYGGACGVRSDGAVFCWGIDVSAGDLTPRAVPLPAPCIGVSVGFGYACAWTADGRLFCWGENHYGQLGDGTVAPRDTAVRATAAPGPVRAASAGSQQTCVELAADGSLWCWGWNGAGELGDGKGGPRATPAAVVVP
jgi:alpha-tubulin suppressor-like RCC1 family protein